MSGAKRLSESLAALPLQALYPAAQLARALGISHRRFQRLLRVQGVHVLRCGRLIYVPLSEIEDKIRPLWEAIKAAEMLRRALSDA
jgi:hypothetical protein